MKQTLILALFLGVSVLSCSKKSNTLQLQTSNTVTIGGSDYSTVKIGSQTWTSMNYNGSGGTNYNNSTNNPTYGKFYTLAEAESITLPTGWRLPTKADAETLLTYLGATGTSNIGVEGDATVSLKLKSKTDWTYTNGNNSSGFNAFPTGESTTSTIYDSSGEMAVFWTNTTDSNSDQYILGIYNLPDGPNIDNSAGMDYIPTNQVSISGCNIRFVKDN